MPVQSLSLRTFSRSNSVESITHVFTNIRVPCVIRMLKQNMTEVSGVLELTVLVQA